MLPPVDAFAPLTAIYDEAPDFGYLRFARKADEPIRRAITERFGYFYNPERVVWRGPIDALPDLVHFLESAGIRCAKGDLTEVFRRRERQAVEAREANEAVAEGPSLADYDFSDLPERAPSFLKIVQRQTTEFSPFVFNDDQVRFVAACADQKRRTGKVRKIVVKRRQRGISTAVQALFYDITKHVPHVESLVMAHEAEAGDKIFLRVKDMYRNDPGKLETGKTGRDNKRELQYDSPWSSALRVLTPSDGAGHGGTRQLVHLTELPLWGSSAPGALNGILNSVPDAPGTVVIIEAAAKGIGNLFHKKYVEAKKGLSDFEVFFIDWKGHEDCSLDVALDDPRFVDTPPEWLEDEPRLRELGYGDRQLAWRRRAIPDKCLGSPEVFKQEYPATPDEAFLSSGSNVFPPSIVDPEWKRLTEVEQRTPARRYTIQREREENETGHLVAAPNGFLRVWEDPEPGVPYLISGDIARGVNVAVDAETEKLDYTTFRVVREWPVDQRGEKPVYEEVAVWHGRMDPDTAAGQMDFLGRWYNTAYLVPEVNGAHGGLLVSALIKKYKYPRVYMREKVDPGTPSPVPQPVSPEHYTRYGWFTGSPNSATKGEMILLLYQLIRDRRFRIHEPEAWAEMATFLRAPDGTMDAAPGEHDDRVIALAIAACILAFHPKARPVEVKMEKKLETTDDGRVVVNYGALMRGAMAKRDAARWARNEDFT